MKILFLLAGLVLCLPAEAQTYRAGGSSRPNFGRSAALEEQQNASAPGAKAAVQTRTFSNYSSRQNSWSKGVQTQPVRAEAANMAQQAAAPKDFAAQVAQTDQAVDALMSGKPAPGAAAASGGKKAAAAAAPETPAQNPVAVGDAGKAAAPSPDMAAAQQALSQMQGMLKGLAGLQQAAGAMGGAGAGASAGNAGAGAASKQMNDALNSHSSDIPAFMNAAGKGK